VPKTADHWAVEKAQMTANAATRHTVAIEINPKLVQIVRSPIYFLATGLMGVSVTFALLFLYWSGQGRFFPDFEWIIVPLCFAVIFCVSVFFFALGQSVAEALRRRPADAAPRTDH
jgi:hypothetical protein